MMNIDKHIGEKYALKVLKYLYPKRYETLKQESTDKPDLKDISNLVGVEVTNAVNEKYHSTLNAYSKNKTRIKDKSQVKFMDNVILQFNNESPELKLEQIKNAFDNKNCKLIKGNYLPFETVDLFIFSSLQTKVEEQKIVDIFKTKRNGFRYIYIMSYKMFYEYEVKNEKLKLISYYDKPLNFKNELNVELRYLWL